MCSQNANLFVTLIQFLAVTTLSLPAVGVQKAVTRQHKGNVNSSGAGLHSRAGSQGGYLWVIHRANTDSLPGLLSPRLCSRPSSCSIKTCFSKRWGGGGGLVRGVFMSAYLQSCAAWRIHHGGPRGGGSTWERKQRKIDETSDRCYVENKSVSQISTGDRRRCESHYKSIESDYPDSPLLSKDFRPHTFQP